MRAWLFCVQQSFLKSILKREENPLHAMILCTYILTHIKNMKYTWQHAVCAESKEKGLPDILTYAYKTYISGFSYF